MFFAEVEAIQVGEVRDALIYLGRTYYRLGDQS